MKRIALLAVAGTLAAAGAAAAQSESGPNLVLSITGGVTTGTDLWRSARVLPAPLGQSDTLDIERRLRPGISAVFSAMYHPGPNMGYMVEIGYFGLASEGRCALANPSGVYAPDTDQRNSKACTAIQGAHFSTSVIGFQAGMIYRVAPAGPVSPYLRATGGVGAMGTSFIETAPVINSASCQGGTSCSYQVVHELDRPSAAWIGTLAAGLTVAAGSGYQARVEIRDFIANLPVVGAEGTGPQFGSVHAARRTRHVIVFTAGIDVLLERRHRRRY